MAARLVLLDADQHRRETLSQALRELGAFDIAGIATVAEAAGVCSVALPDVFVVEGPSLAANDENEEISPNPFAAREVPTILLLPQATNPQRRKAQSAGYTIVIGMPSSPRLIYRRIAHVLQNARRQKRHKLAIALAKNRAAAGEGSKSAERQFHSANAGAKAPVN